MELILSNLRKTFEVNNGEPSFQLDLPDLTFKFGEVVFLVGQNGSGKSLTLKLIAGELQPSSKYVEISFNGKQLQSTKHSIPIVRQKAEESLALELTVEDNLLIRLKNLSFYDKIFPNLNAKSKVQKILDTYEELKRKSKQPCLNLSGGQKQTLAFLGATINSSPLLLLDEFLAATDTLTSKLLRNLAKDYAKNSPAVVLIVSHDIDTALEDADKILLLKQGNLTKILNRGDKDWNKSFLTKSLQE